MSRTPSRDRLKCCAVSGRWRFAAAIPKLSGVIWQAPGHRITLSLRAMNGPARWLQSATACWISKSAIGLPDRPIKVAVIVGTALPAVTIFAKITVDPRPAIGIMVSFPRALMPNTTSIPLKALTSCRIMFRFGKEPWWTPPVSPCMEWSSPV